MLKELWWIRHAQTDYNDKGLLTGQKDVDLSSIGRQQSEALVAHLQPIDVQSVFISGLKRTRLTIEPYLQTKKHTAEVLLALNEVDTGAWTGCRYEEIDPNEWQKQREDPSYRRPNGESDEEVAKRALISLFAITDKTPEGGRSLVVSHGGLIKLLLARVLGFPLSERYRLTIHNASITRLRYEDGIYFVDSINETPSMLPFRTK